MHVMYPLFSGYAAFLLHHHLEDLARDVITKARRENLPILQKLSMLNEDQLLQESRRGFAEEILIPLTQEDPFLKIRESIQQWKANTIILPNDQITLSDLTGVYHVRKLALLEMLSYYEPFRYGGPPVIVLLQEIESYFSKCMDLAFNAYEEIQRGALKKNQEILNGILCNIPVIVSRVDKEGNMVQSLGCGLSSLGLKDGDLVGTNLFHDYPDAHNTRRAINGEKVVFDGSYKSKTGEVRYYQSYFFPEEKGAIGFSIDITEQKVAEEKLRERDYFIEQVADSTPIIIQVYDRINNVDIYSNRELPELLGYTSAQITAMGKSIVQMVVHPDDFPKIIERNKRLEEAKDGEVIESEMRAKHANGSYRWIFTRSTVFKRTPEGKVWQSLSTSIDVTDKKNAEEKAAQQLRIFDTALSNTVDFNYVFDLNKRFIYMNKPLLDLYGKTPEEALGKGFRELGFPEELVVMHNDQLQQVIDTLQPVTGENEFTNEAGQTGYYQYTFVPVIGADGKAEAIVGSGHDISRVKSMAEQQYRSIFESSNDAIFIYDDTGNVAEINPAGCKMHGYTYKEMIGKSGKTFIAKEDHQKFSDFLKDVKEGKKYFGTLRHIRKDGSFLFIEKTGTLFTYKGKPHLLAIVRDITERKIAEEALKESEDRFRTLADNIPNLAFIANEHGVTLWYNKRWFEYTGTTEETMKSLGWQALHQPSELPRVEMRWKESLLTGEVFEMVFPLKGANNMYHPFLTRVIPVKDSHGRIIRWFGTCTDITDQVRIEEVLEKKNKELTKINNDLDNFIYTASHDLKAPVSNIEGLISFLRDTLSEKGTTDDEVEAILNMFSASVARFQSTIKDLTEISKTQRNINEEQEDIVLADIFEETLHTVEKQVRESGAVIRTDFICPVIKFSKRNLKSILQNLLSNAIKYRSLERKPLIGVSCRASKEWYILEVKDNGLGIKKENSEKIFGMFKRLHDHVEGSGVGLYLVKRIVDNAGGKIEVESTEHVGTLFRIYLPKAVDRQELK